MVTKLFINIFNYKLIGIAFIIFIFEFLKNIIFTFTKRKNKKNILIEKEISKIKKDSTTENEDKISMIKNLTDQYNGHIYFIIVSLFIICSIFLYSDIYFYINKNKLTFIQNSNKIIIFTIYFTLVILRLLYNYKINKGYNIKKSDILFILLNLATVFLFILFDKTMAIPIIIMCSYIASFISNIFIDIFDALRR